MAALPSYQFGVSEFTTKPWSFAEDVERYAELGIPFIEVAEEKLDADKARQQLALIGQYQLSISSVQPKIRTLFPSRMQPEPKDLDERLTRFKQTIELVAPFGQNIPFVTNTGKPPEGNIREVVETAGRRYRELADFARDHDARVALEPLNPSTMNEESAIWMLDQALQIVQAVDRPNFGVCVDFWNLFQDADIVAKLRAHGDRTFVVQLADWRTPRSLADRYIVGEGEIDIPPLLRAVHESGYRGPYVVEIFSQDVPDSLYDRDLREVLRQNRAGFDAAWQRAFA